MKNQKTSVQTGLEVLLEHGLPELAGRSVGLITNYTGVDRQLRSNVELLSDRVRLRALFGPEHGILGNVQDALPVAGSVDQRTGLPIYSLYGETEKPTPESLLGLDALIFDIQDVGVRYYTYPSTMLAAQSAAAEAGLLFVVLDRPNPLTGSTVEGNILDPHFTSFVGAHPIPIRHGMTVGELARLFAVECGYPEPLVVPMKGWKRSLWFDEIDLPWIYPSPNLPTLDTATLYPGTCLIEGSNLSEGRGTTRPFELLGAPWIDPFAWVEALQHYKLPGVAFRPTYFTPLYPKHKEVLCGGIQVHIVEREAVRAVEMGLYLLSTLHQLYPQILQWITWPDGSYLLDRLLGSDQPRLALDAGASVPEIMTDWDSQCQAFVERRKPCLLYEE